jgi:hypothetical protein
MVRKIRETRDGHGSVNREKPTSIRSDANGAEGEEEVTFVVHLDPKRRTPYRLPSVHFANREDAKRFRVTVEPIEPDAGV